MALVLLWWPVLVRMHVKAKRKKCTLKQNNGNRYFYIHMQGVHIYAAV